MARRRHLSRIAVMQTLFERDARSTDTAESLMRNCGGQEGEADLEFASALLDGVLQREEEKVGLLIDRISGVVHMEEAACESAPETLQGMARQWLRGVYKLKTELLLILELDQLLTLTGKTEEDDQGSPTVETP